MPDLDKQLEMAALQLHDLLTRCTTQHHNPPSLDHCRLTLQAIATYTRETILDQTVKLHDETIDALARRYAQLSPTPPTTQQPKPQQPLPHQKEFIPDDP